MAVGIKEREIVGKGLVGLTLDDAREAASRKSLILRSTRHNGKSVIVTTDFRPNRVNVATEDDHDADGKPTVKVVGFLGSG